MALIGILAEYNPLHRGHAYQLAWVKRHFPQDQILVLMSGNVVQRGEFAIIDKWHRAQAAVAAGADLVIELPTLASLQSWDGYPSQVGCGANCLWNRKRPNCPA